MSQFSIITFVVLLVGLFALQAFGLNYARIKAKWSPSILWAYILGTLLWLGITGVLAINGFFEDMMAMPPRFPILLAVPMIVILWASFSKKVKPLLDVIPEHQPIFIQSFRIIMEIILWRLVIEDVIPVQMSFEGLNFDILAGIFALPIGYLVLKKKCPDWLIATYNIMGLALLTTIVIIAILSTPSPMRVFMNEPSNTMIAHLPFVWLPAFVVPIAYFNHATSLRLLVHRRRKAKANS